jgi:hypothetical protein
MAAHCSNCSFCDTSKAQVLHEWEEKPELYGIRKYSIPSVIFLLTLTSHHSHFLCAMDLSFIFVLLSHILWNIFFESCTRSGGSVVHQHWMFYELWWDKMILASWLYKQKSSYGLYFLYLENEPLLSHCWYPKRSQFYGFCKHMRSWGGLLQLQRAQKNKSRQTNLGAFPMPYCCEAPNSKLTEYRKKSGIIRPCPLLKRKR